MARVDDLTTPDAWENATHNFLKGRATQVGASLYSAAAVNPDAAARSQSVAKALGIPPQSAAAYPEDTERQVKIQQANPEGLVQSSPVLATKLVDQNTANIIHDDLPNAKNIEQNLRNLPTMQKWDAPDDTPTVRERLSNWWRKAMGQPTVAEDRTAQRAAEANAIIASRRAGVTGDDAAWEASRKAIGGSSKAPEIAAEKLIDSATFGLVAPTDPTSAHSWQESTSGALGQLAGFITGPAKVAGGLIGMTPAAKVFEKVATDSFLKSLAKNVVGQAATLSAASALEQVGHAALDTKSVGEASNIEKEAALGGAGTGAVFGAFGKLLPDSTFLQGVLRGIGVNTSLGALHGDPAEAYDTVKDVLQGNNTPDLEGRVFNLLLNSVFSLHGAGRTEGGWLHDATKMKVAEQDHQTLSTLGQLSASSKWRERDPEGFKNFVQSVTEDGNLDNVYVEGRSFAQALDKAGITPDEVRELIPDVAAQMNEAMQTDGYVRIPTEDYLTHIAGTKFDEELLQHLKTDPDGMTYADAQKFYEEHSESLKALATKGVQDQAQIDLFKQSQEEVQNHIHNQLNDLGRFPSEVNKINASVQASILTRIAAAEGITPEEAFVKYGANIVGAGSEGGFEQPKSPYRYLITNVRGGWTKEKIRKELKKPQSAYGKSGKIPHKEIAKFDSPEDFGDHIFYHGTGGYVAHNLRASITMSERDAERHGGGGYGDRYWAISLSKNKETASNFTGQSDSGSVYPVILKKGANVIDMPELSDASELDDHIEQLWNDGVDAVRLGDWNNEHSEQELAVLNPHAIFKYNKPESYRVFGKKKFEALTKDQIKETYDKAVEATPHIDAIRSLPKEERIKAINSIPDLLFQEKTKQIETPEFKNWFGDSKVVDEEGKPLVVYHGTKQSIEKFDNKRMGVISSMFGNDEVERHGIFVTPSPELANDFATQGARHKQEGANVMPLYVSIKNPLDFTRGYNDEIFNAVKAWGDARDLNGYRLARDLGDNWGDWGLFDKDWNEPEPFIQMLKDLGYDGVKLYEPKVAGEGAEGDTYVAFDPSQIKSAIGNSGKFDPSNPNILEQDKRGSYSPDTKTIALLKDADLSTYLHETGHWALDMYSRVAETNPAIRSEMDKLLNWLGVDSLEKWNSLSVDEQRESHEKFARGFEAYLMEGKAPSVELQSAFARIKAWMVNIYQSLRNLNVELTPEVRGVFDRMLASEEAIRQAEAARVFEPLFKDKPDTMTDEQWADYMTLGQEGTQEAVDTMQAKSLRDMKWLRGAKSKALKELQKQANSLRREVKMQVAKEVMNQPVYRAYTFLTAKDGDLVKGEKRKEYKGNEIDPENDNLFVAIAKLGGLSHEAVEGAWGLKDSERIAINKHSRKGQPVISKTGGVEIDEMAEKLAREGYLSEDEHGKADNAEFEAMFDDQCQGKDRYSFRRDMNEAYGGGWQALPDLPDMAYGKLKTEDLKYMFGEGKDEAWRKLVAQKMTSDKIGIDPQVLSEMLGGFSSGRDMVKQLIEAERPSAVIEGLTDKRMLEEHGELATDRAIDDAASAAIHNEARARFMATGLKILAKSSISARELLKGAKEAADGAVGNKKVKDLNPRQYEVAESKANKQAIKEAPKDPKAAVEAQRAALLNNQLVKSSQQAIADVAKGLDYFKKFSKDSVRQNIDVAFRDQIDQLLGRYDLRKSLTADQARDNRLQSLESFVEKISSFKYNVGIPEALLDAANRMHYKDMTVDSFRGLVDAVKSLEHLGRSIQKITDGEVQRDLNEVALEAQEQMAKMPKRDPDTNRGLSLISKKWINAKAIGRSAMASLLKTEQICDWLDNYNSNGIFNRMVFRKIADAEGKRNDLDLKISKMWGDLVTNIPKELLKENRGVLEVPGVIDSLTGEIQKLSWGEKIALAGIRGDAGHFAKLVKGEKWEPQAILDFLDKNMTKEEWDFVKGLSDTFQELFPLKTEMMREMGSTAPKEVDRISFKTPHGELPGWYWPITYDPARSHSVKERNAKHEASLFEDNIFTRADTSTGRENTRSENYAKPMLLSIDVLPRVLKDEIRDITTRKAIVEADRFLSHPDVRRSVEATLSPEHYAVFNGWLLSLANDAMVKPTELQMWDRLAHGLRTRTTMVGLGFRISTMIQHGLTAAGESVAEAGPKAMAKGLFNSKTAAAITTIGPEWMQKGLDNFMRDTQFAENRDFIFERSTEMRHRSTEIERDVREKLREIQIALMDPATGAVKRATLAVESRAYSGIAMLDMASALPTWMGAYLKGMEKAEKGGLGMNEDDAIYFADKTVRNAHGGGGIKDLAKVQRGSEFFKLFTMFYTFWNHNINRIADTAKRVKELPSTYQEAKESGDWAGFRGDVGMLAMRTFMYTLGVQAVHHMLHTPKEGEQDAETWLGWFAKQMALSAFSGVPVFRDFAAHYAGGKDYELSPISSLIHNTDALLHDMDDNSTSERFIKHAMTEAGYIFGLPLGQPASTTQFLADVWTGRQNPSDITEWWRGLTTGSAQKH